MITALSTGASDLGVHLRADGLALYFASASDLWVSARADRAAPWTAPARIGELASSSAADDPSTTADDLELWFTRYVSSSACLYRTTRLSSAAQWQPPAAQPQLGASRRAAHHGGRLDPVLHDARSEPRRHEDLVHDTHRPVGGLPAGCAGAGNPNDLFEASRPDRTASFGAITPLATLNSAFDDEDAMISANGTELFFASSRPGFGLEDIYVATRSCL